MNKSYFLICNPSSCSFQSEKKIEMYKSLLSERNVNFDHAFTHKRYDATLLTRKALKKGYDVIVAIGGDGTINEVINGFFNEKGEASKASLGVLYSGTSPDFCMFHGIPVEEGKAIENLLNGKPEKIDIGCIKKCCNDNGHCTFYFGSSVNLGLGAGIAGRANRYRKYLGDFSGTLLALIITVINHKPFSFEAELDKETVSFEKVFNITVAKNPYLASGMKLNFDILPSDGKMLFFSINGISRLSFLFLLHKIYSGSVIHDKRFLKKRVSVVRIPGSAKNYKAEFDGDPADFSPVEITIKRKAINLIGAAI